MKTFRAPGQFLAIPALLLVVHGCGGTSSRQSAQEPFPARDRQAAPAVQGTAVAARQHMKAGEYESAISDYRAAHRARPDDRELALEYAESIESIKASADAASDRGDFAAAGGTYDMLLKSYPSFNGLAGLLSFDEARLRERLSHCKKSLSARGFQEYRKGNLSEAIDLWQSLLAIDPDNADIKGAVRTARLQQKNLRERASGK